MAVPLSLDVGTNRSTAGNPTLDIEALDRAFMTNIDRWVRMRLTYIIFGGIFENYAKPQIGSTMPILSTLALKGGRNSRPMCCPVTISVRMVF